MRQPNVHQVRENFAESLAAVERGEEALVWRRGRPGARLAAVARRAGKPRPIGRIGDAGTPLKASLREPLPAAQLSAAVEDRLQAPTRRAHARRATRCVPRERERHGIEALPPGEADALMLEWQLP